MHAHEDMAKAGRGPLIQKTALKGITGGKRDNMTPLLHYPIRQSEAKEIKNQHTKTIKTAKTRKTRHPRQAPGCQNA
jgi:hypothetical protein